MASIIHNGTSYFVSFVILLMANIVVRGLGGGGEEGGREDNLQIFAVIFKFS